MKAVPISVFIVDDDPMMRLALREEVKNNFPDVNFHILPFETGESAMTMINCKPDIAVVDYHLNSKHRFAMNGADLTSKIKDRSPSTEVIVFSSDSNAGLAIESLEKGAHDYVVKNDFMFRRLNVSLLQCLRILRQQKDLKRQQQRNKWLYAACLLLMGATAVILVLP